MIYLIVLGWIGCGILTYSIAFAFFQGEFPLLSAEDYRLDMGGSILFGCFGPFGLFVLFFLSGFGKHGLKFR